MENFDSFGNPKQVPDEDIHKTLQRVGKNDATLKTLNIGNNYQTPGLNGHYFTGNNNDNGIYNNFSVNDDKLSRLGDCIGTNTNLIRLNVQINRTKGEPKVVDSFYEGLMRNSSITCLNRILTAYQANRSRLTALHIHYTGLQNGGDNIITNTIRRCANLKEIKLRHCSITDEMLWPMVEAIRGRKLEKLDFSNNDIGNTGCETIATLLAFGYTSRLCLSHNNIGNQGVTSLANSLMNNTKLDTLEITLC